MRGDKGDDGKGVRGPKVGDVHLSDSLYACLIDLFSVSVYTLICQTVWFPYNSVCLSYSCIICLFIVSFVRNCLYVILL